MHVHPEISTQRNVRIMIEPTRRVRHRAFGNTGMQVSELGLGCARIGGIFQRGSEGFVELLQRAHDLGINFFDTADMYCQGESEQLIGRAFKRRRHQLIIATKVGYLLPGQRQLIARIKPIVRPIVRMLGIKRAQLPAAVSGVLRQSFEPAYIRKAVEASLKRLKTDYIDLMQLHSAPLEVVVRGDWLQTLQDLRRAGKIRFYGVSCDTPEAARAALAVPGISSLQIVVSLLEQSFARELAPQARTAGVAIIARECLANGLLAKPATAYDLKAYCSSAEQEASRRAALEGYREESSRRGIPLSRLALEYATGVDGVAVALVGASRTEQLVETMRAYTG